MDLNGGRPPTPLIEEPRRPPWMLIVILAALAVVVLWVVSNTHISFDDEAETVPPVAGSGEQVVEREEVVPVRPFEPEPAPDAPVRLPVEAPRWARTPQPEYPVPRAGMPLTARVMVSCVVQSEGRLGDCVIVSEDPPGYGFGASALSAARQARLADDARPGARITYTTRFIPPA